MANEILTNQITQPSDSYSFNINSGKGGVSITTDEYSGLGFAGGIGLGGGTATGAAGVGGQIDISGGDGNGHTGTQAGSVTIVGGNSDLGTPGPVEFAGGNAGASNTHPGADVQISGGSSSGASNGGNVQLVGGASTSGSRGKIIINDGTEGTAGYVLTSIDNFGTASWLPSSAPKVAFIYDQQPQGTNGGTASTTGWDTRVLNTLVDPFSIVTSLTSNVITLEAGTYSIEADLVTNGLLNYSQSRFRNTADNTTPALGNLYFEPYSAAPLNHHIGGIFTIASQKTFELQSLANSTQGTLDYGQGGGGGFNTNSGELGCFATLKITKLA